MANALYDNARQLFLTAGLNWSTDTIKAVLVNSGAYTVNLASHTSLADISLSARISTSGALASKTVAGGAAGAANITFTAVSGSTVNAIVLYKDTGTESTSTLIAYIDTATGLPITPNGGDIIVTWDTGPNKIFKL